MVYFNFMSLPPTSKGFHFREDTIFQKGYLMEIIKGNRTLSLSSVESVKVLTMVKYYKF